MTEKIVRTIGKKILRRWILTEHVNRYPYDIVVSAAEQTGSWALVNGRNRVTIAASFVEKVAKAGINPEKAVETLVVHELGHSVYTLPFFEKNGIQRLRDEKIPFPLFNIFEDVRMEKAVEAGTGYRFQGRNLLKKEVVGFGAPEPEMLLNVLKIARLERDFEEAKRAFVKANENLPVPKVEDPQKAADRIVGYYYPAIVAKQDPCDLFPLMREWIDEFHDGESEDEEGRIKQFLEALKEALNRMAKNMEEADTGAGEDDTSELLRLDPTLSEVMEGIEKQMSELKGEAASDEGGDGNSEATIVVTSEQAAPQKPTNGKKAAGVPEELETDTRIVEAFTSREIWEDRPMGSYDKKRAEKLTAKFRKILESKTRYESSKRPAKRFHTRNLVLGRDRQFKRKETERKTRRHVAMVVDCSGSMSKPMEEFHVMFAILNRLARAGLIGGELILSSNVGCQTIELPMRDEDITRIQGEYGGEGLDYTLERTLPLLKRADYVFVATDGNIGDRAVDKKRLRAAGVEPIGLYVGEYDSYLHKWFDRIVIKKTMEELIDELVKKIKGGAI